ncbi:MAG: 2-oxo acid dehydrogenase subunit E2 [Gammaproteobacteria bacterium]|nr:2-oxo acid dehydrogenase subunit E2 [Gammaproteobacteria bacterium]MCY4341269.1 2-oxo acid dehydrogenase subunit E2 [Gammaproteobacteria bacterium]
MPEFNQVRVPGLGEFTDVEVVEVAVSAGDEVAANDPLITLETDKAAMDVPSPGGGRIVSLKVDVGDRVNEGDIIAELEGEAAAADAGEPVAPMAGQPSADAAPASPSRTAPPSRTAAAPPAPSAAQKLPSGPGALPPIDEEGFSKAHASPAVRKFARELGVNLAAVAGSGDKGRIRKADVKAWVKLALERGAPGGGLPQVPEVDFSAHGEIEVVPLGRVQKISGPRLWASWVNIPHVTQHDEADITEVEARRKAMKARLAANGVRLTLLAFVARATVLCLKEFPALNASLTEGGASLALKKFVHLGFAADTERGLLVPVIRNADKLGIDGLARGLQALSGKARDGKLAPDEMQGGSFTISSLGGIGGTAFTPVINAPEVAILGVSRARMTPVYANGGFQPRLLAPLSLSYDHRVIDGATAVRFTTRLRALLADPGRLLAPVTDDKEAESEE